MNESDIDFARTIFVDLVSGFVRRSGRIPDTSEAGKLASEALGIAQRVSSALQPTRRQEPSAEPARSHAESSAHVAFAQLARSWGARIVSQSKGHNARDLVHRLERYVIPHVGNRPATALEPSEILSVLRGIEAKGHSPLAYQIFRDLRAMYRYARVAGLADSDPTSVLGTYVRRPVPKGNAHLTDPKAIGRLLVAIRGYRGKVQSSTRYMLQLAPMLFLRPVELRTLEWSDVDLDAATIVVPADRMKSQHPHIIPLPRQAVKILRTVEHLTGGNRYVFNGGRGVDQPPTFSAFFQMIRRVGYNRNVTPHGFRAMAATWFSEQGWRGEAIEQQLAHVGSANWGRQRSYNRAEYLEERRRMMQAWANHLESLERRATAIPRTKLDFGIAERG